jgi:hypothetical protein
MDKDEEQSCCALLIVSTPRPLSPNRVAARSIAPSVGEVPVQRGPSDTQYRADLLHRVLALSFKSPGHLRPVLVERSWSAAVAAAGASRLQPRHGPLADDLPLEFGQRPENVQNQPAPGRGRIQALLQAPEAHAPALELPDEVYQLPQGPAQPVEPPKDTPARLRYYRAASCLSRARLGSRPASSSAPSITRVNKGKKKDRVALEEGKPANQDQRNCDTRIDPRIHANGQTISRRATNLLPGVCAHLTAILLRPCTIGGPLE